MIQPSLKVVRRGLHHKRRLETLCLHSLNRFGGKVIQQTQAVRACRSNIDVSAFGILMAQPLDCFFDLDGVLTFSQDHFAAIALDADFETLTTHGAQLYPYQPLDNHRGFLAALFALLAGHKIPPPKTKVDSKAGRLGPPLTSCL